jgi:hypothetical protein
MAVEEPRKEYAEKTIDLLQGSNKKENQPFDLGETNIRIVSEIDFSYAEVFQYNLMITFVYDL